MGGGGKGEGWSGCTQASLLHAVKRCYTLSLKIAFRSQHVTSPRTLRGINCNNL